MNPKEVRAAEIAQSEFLKRLRSETAVLHRELENLKLSKIIVSDQITREAYIHYLVCIYPFVKSCEEQFFAILAAYLPDVRLRKKSILIEKDLQLLHPSWIPPVMQGLSETSLDKAFGGMYVMEGSTLGGKFIYSNMVDRLSLDAAHGASYFYGYGADTGKMWTTFLSVLCHYAATTGNESEIIAGACEKFEEVYRLLNT
jgi:heme oxygenase